MKKKIASSISQSDVEERFSREGYENVEFVSRDESPEIQEVDIYYYTYKEEIGEIKRTYDLQIRYVFKESDLDSYWSFDKLTETKKTDEIEGIEGVWRYKNENGKELYINIVSIDLMNKIIEMEYDFKDYAYSKVYGKFYCASSNGVETFDISYDFKNQIHVVTTDDDFKGTICIFPENPEWLGIDGQGVLFAIGSAVWLKKELTDDIVQLI